MGLGFIDREYIFFYYSFLKKLKLEFEKFIFFYIHKSWYIYVISWM